jgi:hypothetical protein
MSGIFFVIRWLGFGIGILLWSPLFSQQFSTNQASFEGASTLKPQPPSMLSASDGVYEKYVLILWNKAENADKYKVFRTTREDGSGLMALKNEWQKSTWMCDYSALPGVDYYYVVVAADEHHVSKLSYPDKGFIKEKRAVATEEGLISSVDVFAAQRKTFLLLADFTSDRKQYRPGERVFMNLSLQNIFDRPSPVSEVRYFLSRNDQLDWEDELLLQKTYNELPAGASFPLRQELELPSDISPGDYYLFVAVSPGGEILSSKVERTKIQIITR